MRRLGPEAIVTNGAGNYTLWVHRFWRFGRFGAQLAPVSGSMGYGLPAAIAAKLADPERPVVSFNGDGCFMMGCQELATAVRHQANVVFVVIDNSSYGTIRMHQERRYPGPVRNGALQSGLRRVRPLVRVPRRDGRAATGDVEGGIRARRRVRRAGGDRPARRPGGDPPAAARSSEIRAAAAA